ncbi:MAG: sigma-70 family RNA polymerase sigma factor [Clostridia bacterium]|nr:sigma-70 family RNA polymerase sigma factor [Clostridia bacterium]
MNYQDIAALVEENMKTIFAYALNRVQVKEEAEDLAGEIITAILGSAPKLKTDAAFFGWFWAIASNTTKKYFRKKRSLPTEELDETYTDAVDFTEEIIRKEELSLLKRELSLLSREYRECTVAYYFDSLSCKEISDKLGISVDMVKYYLYKTRRILKEGMSMTREYGERSYRPATFHFTTIFSGAFNREYQNLFSRKLPGNILYSAYYTPMTIGELSVELGVSVVYLEDEIELLMKYGFLTKTEKGKYQTGLCIFTEAYDREFYRAAEENFTCRLGKILASVKGKLPEIRALGFNGCGMEENRLMWALYFNLLREGCDHWKDSCDIDYPKTLYDNAKGVNYATDYDGDNGVYSSNAFAGYYGISEKTAANFANFGILGDKNALDSEHNWARLSELVKQSAIGGAEAPLVYLMPAQVDRIYESILAEEIASMGELYRDLTACAADIMRSHAPKAVENEIDAVMQSAIFHRTVGLMGKLAVDSGELKLPSDDLPAAVFLFEAKNRSEGIKGNVSN